MARLEAVLFDLDSTLLNTNCLRDFRERRDFSSITEEHISNTKCYSQVPLLLRRLKEIGVGTGIVTNSPRDYADRLIAHHGISDLIDVVITYNDVGPLGKKPSPKGIQLALDALGITRLKRAAYVGDEYTDVIAAYRAGVIPVVPSWASRESVSTPPAAELSSAAVLSMAQDIEGALLFAERCALHKSTDFDREWARFLPLDEFANVVTIRQKMKTFCLGRYFSQKHATTAKLHDSHPLSLEIVKKDKTDNYVPPEWMPDMLLKIAKSAGFFLFGDGVAIDVVTVIPQKPGKARRLELLLDEMQRTALTASIAIEFRTDLLFFDELASKSLRGYTAQERRFEQDNHLHGHNIDLSGKRVLVIDDVITTGSTIGRAIHLLERMGAASVNGLGIAKTVSILDDTKPCAVCGRDMIIQKNGKTGERFWSCSGYLDSKSCIHTEALDAKACPHCGKPLRVLKNKAKGDLFYGCTGYFDKPACLFTQSYP